MFLVNGSRNGLWPKNVNNMVMHFWYLATQNAAAKLRWSLNAHILTIEHDIDNINLSKFCEVTLVVLALSYQIIQKTAF